MKKIKMLNAFLKGFTCLWVEMNKGGKEEFFKEKTVSGNGIYY